MRQNKSKPNTYTLKTRNETKDLFISLTILTPQENEESSPLKIEFNSTLNSLDEEGISDCNKTDNAKIENETKKPRKIGNLFGSVVQLRRIGTAAPRQSMIHMKRLTTKMNFSHDSEV